MSSRRVGDRVETVRSHVDNVEYATSRCPWHLDRSCFLILNNFDSKRFHCLFANHSVRWMSTSGKPGDSCDLPEHFHDLFLLAKELGSSHVMTLSDYFRERSGYTIGMFCADRELFGPPAITAENFAETFYAYVIFLCAMCRRFGGNVPDLKRCTFLYSRTNPVLSDVGALNAEKRERIRHAEYFNAKKWTRFLRRKTARDVVRYARANHPQFFKKKAEKGSRCVLMDGFDGETHRLVCESVKKPLCLVLEEFKYLAPNPDVRNRVVEEWIRNARYE